MAYSKEEIGWMLPDIISEVLRGYSQRLSSKFEFNKKTRHGIKVTCLHGERDKATGKKQRKLIVEIIEDNSVKQIETGYFTGGYSYKESEEIGRELTEGFCKGMVI